MRRSLPLNIVLVVGSLTLTLGGPAAAQKKTSTVKLKGPASNKLGTRFSFKVSGFAASPADYVSIRESQSSCTSTYAEEFALSGAIKASRYVTRGKSFSFKAPLHANSLGTHYLCVYVINSKTIQTYAHASAHFKNHV